jgi:short subunit dehydrogenase-like uncharacterized protein
MCVCACRKVQGRWRPSSSCTSTHTPHCMCVCVRAGKCRDGGVLTPASALGLVLLERLRAAGFKFIVHGPKK